MRTAGECKRLTGVDLSEKTLKRCKENLRYYNNFTAICSDFLDLELESQFDRIYSSLTFMHIRDKCRALAKVSALLQQNGIFILSLDKNRENLLVCGDRAVQIYPDDPQTIQEIAQSVGLKVVEQEETEFAWILVMQKN